MFIPLLKPALRIAGFVISIILFVFTILSAYGGRFDTDIFTFPAILTLALPYLALLTLLVTIAWFCAGKLFAGALGVLTILVSWGPISTNMPMGGRKEASPGAETFKIMTYNMIHGWDLEDKGGDHNRTVQYIIESGCDIVCLQEIINLNSDSEVPLFTESQRDELRKIYPYWVGDPSLDMKVLSKYPIVFEKGYNYIDGSFDPKRYTFYKLNVKGHKMTLINVHLLSFMLTSQERDVLTKIRSVDDFKTSYRALKGDIRKKLQKGFKKRKYDVTILRETIDRIKGPLIICGDFNDVPESYAYRLLKGEDMRDAYVETNFWPTITYNRHAFWFHLDQIFYRGPLKALWVERGDIKTSDHYPLIAEFEFTDE